MATKTFKPEKQLEKQASEFRQQNGFSDRDCIRLKSLLHQLNILTVYKPLSDRFAGMTLKINSANGETNRFILVNSNQSLGRQHFTICHELYHLYVQENFTSQICNPGTFGRRDPEEYRADWFAAYLLIPHDGGLKMIDNLDELELNQISLATILRLEQYFTCSRSALLCRLEEMNLVDRAYDEQFRSNIIQNALSFGYAKELYEPSNHNQFVGNYGTLAKTLFGSNTISESHYFSILLDLGISIEDLQRTHEQDYLS